MGIITAARQQFRADLAAFKLANPSATRAQVRRFGCAVCGALPGSLKYRFAVDHDHDTGEIRGILCGNCNRGIGYLGDTLEGVERAVRYLRQMSDSTIDRVQ